MAQQWRKLRRLVDVEVKLGGHVIPPGDVKLSGDYWAQFSPQFLEVDPTAPSVVKAPTPPKPVAQAPKAPAAPPVAPPAPPAAPPAMPPPPTAPESAPTTGTTDAPAPSTDASGASKGKKKKS